MMPGSMRIQWLNWESKRWTPCHLLRVHGVEWNSVARWHCWRLFLRASNRRWSLQEMLDQFLSFFESSRLTSREVLQKEVLCCVSWWNKKFLVPLAIGFRLWGRGDAGWLDLLNCGCLLLIQCCSWARWRSMRQCWHSVGISASSC